MHACDVLQTTHYFISQTGLAVRTPLSGQSSGKNKNEVYISTACTWCCNEPREVPIVHSMK